MKRGLSELSKDSLSKDHEKSPSIIAEFFSTDSLPYLYSTLVFIYE